MSIKNYALELYGSNKKDIFSFIYEDKKYWLKKARATKPDKIQNFFYKFFPLELLIPPLIKDAKEALEFETLKLKRFATLGVNVARVVYIDSDFFVLEDSGVSIYGIFRESNITKEYFYTLVDKTLELLAKSHNLGEFHGGSQLRNFTLKDDTVFMIDFEESFDDHIDIKSLQYRDFLLFLLSFVKLKELSFKIDYLYIVDRYISLSKNYFVAKKLKKLASKISLIAYVGRFWFIKDLLGSDVKYFFELFDIIKSLEIKLDK